MFRKILIANRGEIALRILRACRDLKVSAVVAYSDADRESLAVQLADEAVCIGPAPAARSYTNIPALISAALVTGCDALHPGYGFLAENSYLADICQQVGVTFIGPPSDVIAKMGNKAEARKVMREAGVPLVPGTRRTGPESRRGAPGRPPGRVSGHHQSRCRGRRTWYAGCAQRCGVDHDSCRLPSPKPNPPSPTATSTSNAISIVLATSKSRSWPITTVTSTRSASAIARCSGATRRCSKRHLPQTCRAKSATTSSALPSKAPRPRATGTRERWNSCSIARVTSTSWR